MAEPSWDDVEVGDKVSFEGAGVVTDLYQDYLGQRVFKIDDGFPRISSSAVTLKSVEKTVEG